MENTVGERLPEERERLSRIVDGLPAWKLIQVMNSTVGAKRSAQLIGWCVIWGLSGELSVVDLRRRLEAEGMTYVTAYRAINDFHKVGDALLSLDGYAGSDVFRSMRVLAAAIAL